MNPEQIAALRRVLGWLHSAEYHETGAVMVPTVDLRTVTDLINTPASAMFEPCDQQAAYQEDRAEHRFNYNLPQKRERTRRNF